MNDLQIINKNGDLNTTLDMLDVISKKGPREFLTRMGELRVREDELQANCYIAELELRKSEIELQKDKEKTNRVRIKAQRDVLIEKEKTDRIRIKENSKCIQKLLEVSQAAYNRKFDFFESMLKFCKEDVYPRVEKEIQSLDSEIKDLEEKHSKNFEDQEAHMIVWKLLKQKKQERETINDKFESIMSCLIKASEHTKLEFGDSFSGYIE